MYLSKLELHGFKSFAAPTALHFDPGITAIVGPNGCGKSNIVDAVRWVIGEQRARILRSEKMENVIFNGTSKRRPLGLAEVQLTIENTRGVLPTEYSEVTLGRRLYRSGESEYLLNGVPCRLKDIVDLFMDTGMGAGAYSVIELKMVEEILSDNAQDRRHLFEEAAGITKYKLRRGQALRKLDTTQADLTRLRDLTEEIEKRVRSLKRQASRAARHRDLEERLHHLELTLAQAEYTRLTERARQLDAEKQHFHDELEGYTAQMAADEARLEALRTALIAQEQDLSEHQQRLAAHEQEVRALEADLRLVEQRLETTRRDRERTLREAEEATQQRAGLEKQTAAVEEAEAEALPARDAAERLLEEAAHARDAARRRAEEHREALHDLRHREQAAQDRYAADLRALDRLANRLDLLTRERAALTEQIAEHEAGQATQRDAREAARVWLEDARARRDAARDAFEKTEMEHEGARTRLDAAIDVLRRLERRHDAALAEAQVLDSLVASFDEFSDAVQFLAASPAWAPPEVRTVADVLTCAPEHRLALDAALGDLGACLVVRSEEDAYRAATLLRAEQKGQATFLLLDRLRGDDRPPPGASGGTPMQALVQAEAPRFAPLVPMLLRDCYFAETLEAAQAHAQQMDAPARHITAAGEWVDARGLVHAGDARAETSATASRLGRREQLREAREHVARLQDELDAAATAVEAARAALDALPLDAHRHAVAEAEQQLAEAERLHTRHRVEQDAAARRQAELAERLAALEAEAADRQKERAPLEDAAADAAAEIEALRAERETAEDAFQQAEAASRSAQDRFAEANVAAVEARNRVETLRRDRERTRQDLEALAQRAETRSARLGSLADTIRGAEEDRAALGERLEATRAQRGGLEDAVAQSRTALLQQRADVDVVEARLRKLRQAREQSLREENVRAVRQAEIQTRTEDLLASVHDAFGRALPDEPVPMEADFNEAAARQEVQSLRQSIKNLGSVNALALDEYEEEKERLDFMTSQMDDLERAEATLLETIDEINTTAAARFAETYEAIRTSFRMLFTELFGQEAAADLALADPDDPLESPIDIVARPRGKRPVGISQLSSGEKTLTAIALLFAIYLVKPSPFCLLDEVDAPLDDANVDRFMRLIRRFAEDTQFILVTHNKRTMEMADRLYGITMQEQGISRLVGVRFEDALEMAGA